jgi:hypothetical protein
MLFMPPVLVAHLFICSPCKTLRSHLGSLLLHAMRLICFAAIPSRVKVHYWLQAPMMGRQEYGVEMVGELLFLYQCFVAFGSSF